MSRHLTPFALSAALFAGAAGADAPKVAVDIAPVHSLVSRVMQGVGSPDLVIPAGASPHGYNLRPSEAAALQNADMVFWVGEDLTPWLHDSIDTLASDAAKIALMDVQETRLFNFREGALFEGHDHEDHNEHAHEDHDEHAHEDHDEHAHKDHDEHAHKDHGEHAHKDHGEHAHEDHDEHAHDDHEEHAHEDHKDDAHDGHAHGADAHDPHVWLSVENAKSWLNIIAARLSAVDPENASTYFENAAEGRQELTELARDVSEILDPIRGGRFIVFHDAYQYFEQDFDLSATGAIALSDASKPSPARVSEIQERLRAEKVDCVLAEPQFNAGLVATVLEGTEAKTGVIDPLGAKLSPGPNLYPEMIRSIATTIAECI